MTDKTTPAAQPDAKGRSVFLLEERYARGADAPGEWAENRLYPERLKGPATDWSDPYRMTVNTWCQSRVVEFVERREPTARDDQSAKLERAMAVVERCIVVQETRSACFFCGFFFMQEEHADDCPLVGFVDKEGNRLP